MVEFRVRGCERPSEVRVMISQLYVTPEMSSVTFAVVAVGAIMIGSGEVVPSSKDEHVSMYPVRLSATILD